MSKFEPSSERVLEGGRIDTPQPGFISGVEQIAPALDDFVDGPGVSEDGKWLSMATRCYNASTDFFNATLRRRLEDAMSLFNSKHPHDSKYNTAAFAKRSKAFRPKTRTMVRKLEAAALVAFFSTDNFASCNPPNASDKVQVEQSKVQEAMLNYRLNMPEMAWMQTVIGALQDAARQGFVVAYTGWDYREGKRYYREQDQSTGAVGMRVETYTSCDRPCVSLRPAENIRIDPGVNWLDPINSSPYLIDQVPMFVSDIRERMTNPKYARGVRYRQLTDQQMLAGLKNSWDSVRARREGNRLDRYENHQRLTENSVAWVHKNIVRVQGEDYYFETLGTTIMLTDPVPLAMVELRGYRPYVFGYLNLESHNPYPDGTVSLTRGLQEEANDLANMATDAAKMATMGRYFVRRGSNVDLDALARFTPASAIEMRDVSDVKWDRAPDPTRQVTMEREQLNKEMDDLGGNYSGSMMGVQRNQSRSFGEADLLGQGAELLTEYQLRIFAKTFIMPVLEQINDSIRIYESDTQIAAVIGARRKAKVDQVFRALELETKVHVDCGYGSTNPGKRIERLAVALSTIQQIDPTITQSGDLDIDAVMREVFGAVGFGDGSRFVPKLAGEEEDAQVKQLKAKIQQLQQMVDSNQQDIQGRIEIAKIAAEANVKIAQLRSADARNLQTESLRFQLYVERLRTKMKAVELDIANEGVEIKKQELYMQREALSNTIQLAEREFALKLQTTPLAPPPHAAVEPAPSSTQQLVTRLRTPASGPVALEAQVPGVTDNAAGVISRGDYGAIPGMEG